MENEDVTFLYCRKAVIISEDSDPDALEEGAQYRISARETIILGERYRKSVFFVDSVIIEAP